MGILALALLPFAAAFAFYLYFFLKRMGETFGLDIQNKTVKAVVALIAISLAATTMSISSPMLIAILHLILIALLVQLVNFILKKSAKKKYEDGFVPWKKIYGSGMIPILLTIAILIGGYINLHNVVETKYTVYTNKNIREEGYRVALVADVHFGVSLDYREMLEKCNEISEKDVDIVILCGDIVDNATTPKEMRQVFQALGSIKSEYGIYYVYGNHDRSMSMMKSDFSNEELIDAIEENHITILRDETLTINDDLVLIGREDRSSGRRGNARLSIDELLSRVDQDAFLLTLDHQPNEYKENGEAGTDLLLSGHTHGGQIFPADILQELIPFNDGVYGRYKIDEDTQAIVTSGFAGWAYPFKTAAKSEYVIVDIQKNP